MLPLPRLMPALVTPFDRSGRIDLIAHRHNLGHLWDLDVRGFLIGGSTGEGPYLEQGERQSLVAAARHELGKRATLICGVAAETLRGAMAMVKEAEAGGADAVLVLTPTTVARGRIPYVERFFEEVADFSPMPVFLYSVPGVTAFELPEPSVARLADHPNIHGIKDSGGDPVRMQRLFNAVDEDFQLMTGSSQALTLCLAAGAYGAITASTNYAAELALQTVSQARRSPIAARHPQAELSRLARVVEAHGVPGVKLAATEAGLEPGWPRAPLQPLPPALARRLAGELAQARNPVAPGANRT